MRSLHLVRHGRTAANAGGLLLGRLDPDLDAEGTRHATAVAASLAMPGRRVERVVTSPLARCRATAAVIAAALGDCDVEVDDRWIELDYGALDGTPIVDVPSTTWTAWQGDVHWRPPGGESLAEVGARVRGACDDLAAASDADGDVVVVSHVSPIKAAVAWALGVGDEIGWRMFVAPGSVTRIVIRPDGSPSLHAFNELPGLP